MDVNEKQFTIASNLSSYSLIHEKNTKIFVYEMRPTYRLAKSENHHMNVIDLDS